MKCLMSMLHSSLEASHRTWCIHELPREERRHDAIHRPGQVPGPARSAVGAQLGPLLARKRTRNPGCPTSEEIACFEAIKEELTDEKGAVLRLPNLEKEFFLICDAATI